MYIYMVNFIQKNTKYTKKVFCTITCKYLYLNVGMELPTWKGNGVGFSCSALYSVMLLLEQYEFVSNTV